MLNLFYRENGGPEKVSKLPGLSASKWRGWDGTQGGIPLASMLVFTYNVSSHVAFSPGQFEVTLVNCFTGYNMIPCGLNDLSSISEFRRKVMRATSGQTHSQATVSGEDNQLLHLSL